MIAAAADGADLYASQRTETWFRRILILFSIVAGLGILCHFGIMLWADNGFTGPKEWLPRSP